MSDEAPDALSFAFLQLMEQLVRQAERYTEALEALVDGLRAEQARALAPKLRGRR